MCLCHSLPKGYNLMKKLNGIKNWRIYLIYLISSHVCISVAFILHFIRHEYACLLIDVGYASDDICTNKSWVYVVHLNWSASFLNVPVKNTFSCQHPNQMWWQPAPPEMGRPNFQFLSIFLWSKMYQKYFLFVLILILTCSCVWHVSTARQKLEIL